MSKHHRGSNPPAAPPVKTPSDTLTLTILGDGSGEALPEIDADVAALMAAEDAADAPADMPAAAAAVHDVATVTTTGNDTLTLTILPHEPGRLVAGQPSTVDVEDVLAHYQIEPDDVLKWRGGPEEPEGLVVVTAAGEKIRWPQDIDRKIPRSRLSTKAPVERSGRTFPEGYLRRDASKDPKD